MTTMAQRVAARRLMADGYFSVGDEILFGKYKNKRGKVLRFFEDDRGVPSVEIEPVPKGRKQNKTIGLYKIWKTKAERQKQACVIFSKNCDGDIVLGKVRDRMYDPSICVYHLEVDGTEMCVMFDRITGFCEGINEHGLAIVNSSLMVLQDEREGMADGDTDPERSPDGIKIIKALTKRTIPEVLRTLITYKPKKFQRGLKGHTLVSNGKEVYALENTRIHTPKALKLKPDEVNTRTNHGIYYPGAGYTKGDDYLSSIVRQWESKKQLEKVRRPEDLMPSLTQSIEKTEGDMNPVRFTDKMRTTSQMVADPAKGEMLLYLVPGHSKFEGVRNLLPDGRKPKMKVRVFKYPSKGRLKDPYVTVPDELDSASAKKSLRRQVMAQRVATRALQADKLPGGLADKKTPSDFDSKQLAKGLKVELEHTEDRAVAQEVAMDHLTEDKAYYDKLETIEKQGARYKSKKTVKKQDGGDMTVYEYSDRQVADRNRKKAERIEKLRTSMRKLQTKVRKDVQSKDEKIRDVALAVGLMDETFERVGNPGSAKEGHFGVTTWQVKHIKFGKGGATITYVGKSGVDQNKKLSNPRVVSALKKVCKEKGKDDCVLSVSAADVNTFLKSFGISAKDIRGFHANTEMKAQLKKVRKGKLPKDDKERKEKLKIEFKAALEATAERVGHQASTLKSQYLVPGLEDDYMKDGTVSESHTRKGSLRTAAENGTPTERRILANAVNAPVLVIRDRQWWLREAPSIYRMAREHEKARPSIEGIRFDPQVFSVLWYEDADGNNLGEPKYSNDQPPVEPEGARYQRSQFPNYLRDSILRLNDDGTSTAVMEGNQGFSEDLVTAMVRSEQWDVGDAIMVAAQACSRCMNGLAHHYGLKWGMEIGSEEFLTHNTVCSMCEHHEKVATKSKSEREEEGAETLVRKSPKKKPPRYDLRDHSGVDEEDPDLEGRGGGDKGDRDLSLKWNKVGRRVAWRWRSLPESPSAARVALQRMAEAEAPAAPPAGGAGQKAPTFDVWVKEKRWPSKAENAPPGAEVGFEGLKKQDPGTAEKVRAEFKRQFPSADDEGGDKGKKKDDEGPKERSYEDIDAELEEARNDEDELENTVEELEEQIKASKVKLKKLRQQKRKPKIDPDARREEIQSRIDQEKQKMRDAVAGMKVLGREMSGHEDAIEPIKKEMAALKVTIKAKQKRIKDMRLEPGHRLWKPYNEEVEDLREQLREKNSEIGDSKKDLKAKEKERTQLRDEGREAAKAVTFLEGKLQEVEEQPDEDDPKEQVKAERKKLDDAEEELKESREDLKAKTKRVNDLKDEREDPTGANQKRQEAAKIEKRKRIQEAVKKTTEVMENLMGKGSTVPKVTRQAIEDQLVEMNEEAMEIFALEFENSIKSLTDQDPSSDESVDLANAMALQGYTTKGANTPEELAERVAQITYARNVVANPLIAGGKPVGQTGELSNDGWQARAIDGFNQFQRLDKDLRLQAHGRLEEALKGVEEDSPQAQELEAIRAGMNMAHVADTGEALPGQQQPTKASAALVRKMVETGNAREMLRPTQDMFTPESRKGMRQSLNAMSDKDLVDLVIGEDPNHPFASWKDIMETPDSTAGEFKQFIKSFLVDDWMNDIWGDRAARDVMEAAGVEGWDDNEARAGISDQAKHNAGPGRQKAMEAGVRVEEAKKDGKRPDPDDEALVDEWFGEGGRGLRENTQSLLDTLKDKFNKWVISPATSVLKHFTETGDQSVFETETVPHADEASPEPRTQEQREKARADAPESSKDEEKARKEKGLTREKWEGMSQSEKDKVFDGLGMGSGEAISMPGAKYSPEQIQRGRTKLKALRTKMKAQRAKVNPAQRKKLDAQLERIEGRLSDLDSDAPGDLSDVGEQPEDKEHKAGEVWRTDQGNWRAKNKKNVPKSFKDKAKAEQFAGRKLDEKADSEEEEEFSADFNIPVENKGPTRMATDKIADLWLAKVRSIHPDDPNRPMIVVKAA